MTHWDGKGNYLGKKNKEKEVTEGGATLSCGHRSKPKPELPFDILVALGSRVGDRV